MNKKFFFLTIFLFQFFITTNLSAAKNIPVFLAANIYSGHSIWYHPWEQTENQNYDIDARARVSDIDGLDDIASVILQSPDGTVFKTLYDDGLHGDGDENDGYYTTENIVNTTPPPLGNYRLIVTDNAGGSSSYLVSIRRYLDIPDNPSPGYEEHINNATPTFSWDEVDDAVSYSVSVSDAVDKVIWFQDNITSTSVVYNNDGTGESLIGGNVYTWDLIANADVTEHAFSDRFNIPFIYSSVDDQQALDDDGDGYAADQNDCDYNNPSIYPGAIEICGDGIDQDCDGEDKQCVVSDIKANGSDGPLTITSTDNLSIRIELSPGGFAGDNADWWLLAATPFGWFHYQPDDGSWMLDLTYSHQGPLFNLGEFEVLDISGLPTGAYTLYFGVDMDMNGSLDMDQAYYDSVIVNISDGGGNPEDIDDDGDGYAENEGDCNDSNPDINPGATEICGDGIDQDCDGRDLACELDPNNIDNDGDGFTENQGDCNDNDVLIYPGTETCGDSVDPNGNGSDSVCIGLTAIDIKKIFPNEIFPLKLVLISNKNNGEILNLFNIVADEGCVFDENKEMIACYSNVKWGSTISFNVIIDDVEYSYPADFWSGQIKEMFQYDIALYAADLPYIIFGLDNYSLAECSIYYKKIKYREVLLKGSLVSLINNLVENGTSDLFDEKHNLLIQNAMNIVDGIYYSHLTLNIWDFKTPRQTTIGEPKLFITRKINTNGDLLPLDLLY